MHPRSALEVWGAFGSGAVWPSVSAPGSSLDGGPGLWRSGRGGGRRSLPGQVSSPGAGFGNQAAGDSRLRWEVGGRRGEKCTGGRGWGPQGRTGQAEARASMFSRNHRSRVTVARGSALEMEFKRGRFRLSVFSDPPEVSDRVPALPSSASPGRLCLPRGTAHATVREQTDASY